MGLDVYVRWGSKDAEGELVGMDEDARQEQFTGFRSAPYAGYLRESWESLAWVGEMAKTLNAPNPYNFFGNWEGYNGEELPYENPEQLKKILDFRDNVLRPWLRGPGKKAEHLDKIIDRSEKAKAYEEFQVFHRRIEDAIGFINFIEIHKDKPGLHVLMG